MTIQRDVYCILGLPFDKVNLSQALTKVLMAALNQQGYFLSTPNLNFVVAARKDRAFYQSVVNSDLVVVDGSPIIWVARCLGLPFTERVAGSDLFLGLTAQTNQPLTVFFFGGEEGVAKKAHEAINSHAHSLTSVGYHFPGFVDVEAMSTETIRQKINQLHPDLLVVALGAKKGQAWIEANKSQLKVGVVSHLGAVINFTAGQIERAPRRWQKVGAEWLWRIKQEPQLAKRYLLDAIIFLKLLIGNVIPLWLYGIWLKRRKQAPLTLSQSHSGGQIVLSVGGSLQHSHLKAIKTVLEHIINDQDVDVVMDWANLTYIDSAAIGTLLLLQARLTRQKRSLKIINLTSTIRRLLFLHGVSHQLSLTACEGE